MYTEIKTGIEMERHYGLGNSRLPVAIETIALMVKITTLRLICKIAGHKLVDHSCAGPDTGNVSIECTRCGFSHSATLY